MNNFLDNKYTKWYFQIVEHRQNNRPEGYTERHHIIPRCMKGTNDASNLVYLTAREHFVCHHLLVKMTSGKSKNKLWYALNNMLMRSDNQKRYIPSSRTYQYIKEQISQVQSIDSKARWKNSDIRERMKSRLEEYWKDPKNKQRASQQFTEMNNRLWQNSEYRKMKSELTKAWNDTCWWENPQYKKILSETSKKQWKDPQFRKKKTKESKELFSRPDIKEKAKEARDKFWSDENNKKRMSLKATEKNNKRWSDPKERQKRKDWCNELVTCEYCEEVMKRVSYGRHKKKNH